MCSNQIAPVYDIMRSDWWKWLHMYIHIYPVYTNSSWPVYSSCFYYTLYVPMLSHSIFSLCIYRALTTFMPTLLTATTTHALTSSHKVRMLSYNASHCLCAPVCVCACYLRGNVWFRMYAVGLCCIVLQYQYPLNCTVECFIMRVCLLWPCTQDHWQWQRMTFGAWSLSRRAMSLWWSQGEVHRRKKKGCM